MSARAGRTFSIALFTAVMAAACGGTVRHDETHDEDGGHGAASIGNGGTPNSGGHATTGSGGSTASTGGSFFSTGGVEATDPIGCAGIVEHGDPIILDTLILLDRSDALSCDVPAGGDRWTKVRAGISAFLAQGNTPYRSVGIEYFGVDTSSDAGVSNDAGLLSDAGASCSSSNYETPDVELAPLSQNTQLILDSLGRHGPGGGRPTAAALTGALKHAADWTTDHPGHKLAVTLVTSGEPDDCGSSADVASAAVVGSANGVSTFVIELVDASNRCALDPTQTDPNALGIVARAGGSRNPFLVDLEGDVEAELVDTLNQVQLTVPPTCQYRLPPLPQGSAIDAAKINVAYRAYDDQPEKVVSVVADEAACDTTKGGWYYDDARNPTEIELCPATCSAIDAQRASVMIYVGCTNEGSAPP